MKLDNAALMIALADAQVLSAVREAYSEYTPAPRVAWVDRVEDDVVDVGVVAASGLGIGVVSLTVDEDALDDDFVIEIKFANATIARQLVIDNLDTLEPNEDWSWDQRITRAEARACGDIEDCLVLR